MKKRICMLDMIRGILIIYVVFYHTLYDINDILGYNIPFLYSDWFSTLRDFMSGSLIFISGISCNLSKNNLKRGVKTFAVAMVLTAVTYFVMPDQLILFGILHFLGSMMLLYGVLERVLKGVNSVTAGVMLGILGVLFVVCRDVYYGYLSVASMHLGLPDALYGSFPMYILGFAGPYFSADYYPVIPWGFLFFAGAMAGRLFIGKRLPDFMYKNICPPLAFLGRHTLAVYMIHQPVLFGIFLLVDYLL